MGMSHEELQSKELKLYDFTQSEPGSRVLHYLAKEAAFLGATGVISTEIMNKMIDEGKVEVRVPEICIREGALRIDMSFDLTDEEVSSELPQSISYNEYTKADAAERAKRKLNLTIGIKWSPRLLSLRRPFGLNDEETKAFTAWFIKLDAKYGSGAVPVELAVDTIGETFRWDDGVISDACIALVSQNSNLESGDYAYLRISSNLRLEEIAKALKNASPQAVMRFMEELTSVEKGIHATVGFIADHVAMANGARAEEATATDFTRFFKRMIKESDLEDKDKENLLARVEELVNGGMKPEEIAKFYAMTKFANLVEKAKAAEKEAREKAKEAKSKEAEGEGEGEGESDPPKEKADPKKGRDAFDEAMAKATVSAGELAKYYAWDSVVSAQETAATEALKDFLVDQKVIASRDDYVAGFQIPLLNLFDFYLSNEEGFVAPNMVDRKVKAIAKKYSEGN